MYNQQPTYGQPMGGMFDFNDAEPQKSGDVIPENTICKVAITVKPGGTGLGGWATASKTSDVTYLNCEFTVTDGPYAKRKLWQNLTLSGGQVDEKGQSKAWGITKSTLRAIIDSAFGLQPSDDSPAARQRRVINSWEQINGLEFAIKVGVEKGKDGYADKNKIKTVLTPDMKEYAGVMMAPVAGYAAAPMGVPAQAMPMGAPPAGLPMNQPAYQQPVAQPQQTAPMQQGGAAQAQGNSAVPAWAR